MSEAKQPDHLNLPWEVYDYDGHDPAYPGIESHAGGSVVVWGTVDDDGGVRGETLEQAKARAEFIVRACNNYERLLAACKRSLEVYDTLTSLFGSDAFSAPFQGRHAEGVPGSLRQMLVQAIEDAERTDQ